MKFIHPFISTTVLVVKTLAFTPSFQLLNHSPTNIRNTHRRHHNHDLILLNAAKIGIFYGTSTGNTQSVADLIAQEFGPDLAEGPFDIDSVAGSVKDKFQQYDCLIVGTPTWNTGADSERSGTGWDEIYYGELQDLDISGKNVAVFGLGDQVSYSENYADATGELHDVFEKLGCKMMGYTSQEGYEHEASKSIRGDLFCGLLCDNINQEDLTSDRVKNWVEQLKSEGILDGSVGTSSTSKAVPAAPAFVATESSSTSSPGKVGIFYGTSTGNTQSVADLIAQEFGPDVAEGPFDIDSVAGSVKDNFQKYGSLIVGTPTWNTGADSERSGTGWDEIYYGEMQELDISGKNVAVFGLGDQVSYSENYADATGELHDVFEKLGCKMMGYTSQEGYEHEASKSIRGDLFCGLLCDNINQEDLTSDRVKNWVEQLKSEGILDGSVGTVNVSASTSLEKESIAAKSTSVETSKASVNENNHKVHSESYTPHYNAVIGKTMWTSADGKSCYYTTP